MDGNGRWAKQRNKPRVAGHKAGVEATREVVQLAAKQGVEMGGRGRHVSNPLEMSRVQSMPPSKSMDRKSRLVAMEKAAAGYQLPDGWESAVDESTGDAYYFHGASGTTQWDFPE